jgi:hypothetical protein
MTTVSHAFQFRLHSEYASAKNDVASLQFEHHVKNGWQLYEPRDYTAGFLVLLYAIFNCQHLYFRVNAAERGIQLTSADGFLTAVTDDQWHLQKLHIHFDAVQASGNAAEGDEDYIIERMEHCPVSVNIKRPTDTKVTLRFL